MAKQAGSKQAVSIATEERIEVFGAREHNLKNIDITIPKNQLVVFTGVSGSGKYSLAFDTIYNEGQRRYMQSFRASDAYSYNTGKKMTKFSKEEIVENIFEKYSNKKISLLAPLVRGRKGDYR